MGLAVGIDVGGTKIAGGVVDEGGKILATARRESPATDTEAIERNIQDLVAELRADTDRLHVVGGAQIRPSGTTRMWPISAATPNAPRCS